jgi:rhodanese-related sulfurtransferase/DNA-binding transcriptional ArsR family regulator
MGHRDFKDPLYEHFARIGHALGSPRRIELLDLLAQGEKTVELLAEQSEMPVKNTSAHLRVLRQARLVETRRQGTFVHYRLAGDDVVELLRSLQTVARNRLAEVEQVTNLYLTRRDQLEPVTRKELRRLVRDGLVTILDARPREEYEAGHIPGALSVPVEELERRLSEVPTDREVIAYCRGPYCVYSLEAVTLLRQRGYRARRTEDGLPAWRSSGLPVATGRSPSISRTPKVARRQ